MSCRHVAETTRRVKLLNHPDNVSRETSCQLKLSSMQQCKQMNIVHANEGLGAGTQIGATCPYGDDVAQAQCRWYEP